AAARDLDQHVPLEAGLPRQVEQQIAIDAREPSRRLGALEITRAPVDALRDSRQKAHVSPATIHVSLLPPPCEEFTTSDPRLSATRVKPPGVTYMRSPCRMNGRRSRCRGSISPCTSVGAVESFSTGCAM